MLIYGWLQALVGFPNSSQFHVFEVTRQLPRFSMYALLENKPCLAQSYVQFKINERLQRICMWINQNFLLTKDIEVDATPDLKVHLRCLRDNKDLEMHFGISGKVQIFTDNLQLAADLVQSLASFNNIETLEVNIFNIILNILIIRDFYYIFTVHSTFPG